ncbi:MAG: hypothetical protein IPJ46_09400 [Anaerolineales bacterium]|nr:hypothetical protein [Anaerolineales bacterium]
MLLARLEHLTTDRAAPTAGERLGLWGVAPDLVFPKIHLGSRPKQLSDFLENKTLHNDFLSNLVWAWCDRITGIGAISWRSIEQCSQNTAATKKIGDAARPVSVIFLAMLVGAFLESNAHQIFHFRTVWLGLALQEATLIRMMLPPSVKTMIARVELGSEMLQSPEKSSPSTDHHDPSFVEAG